MGFRGNIAVLRNLEGFFEKIEESRPPLKLKIMGVYLLTFFSRMLLSKVMMVSWQGANPKIFEK